MHVAATPGEARTILRAMLDIASSGGAPTDADRASVLAAARYIFKLNLKPDLADLKPASADRLRALAENDELAEEAVSFAVVMAFVDGRLDDAKLKAVLRLASRLGVHDDFVEDVTRLAHGHLKDATAHMIRAN